MTNTTTTYAHAARDRNGDVLRIGDSVVIERGGRFIHGSIIEIVNPVALGLLLKLSTRDGLVMANPAAAAFTKRTTTRRAAS